MRSQPPVGAALSQALSHLSQIFGPCVSDRFAPDRAGESLLRVIARAGHAPDFSALAARVKKTRAALRRVFGRWWEEGKRVKRLRGKPRRIFRVRPGRDQLAATLRSLFRTGRHGSDPCPIDETDLPCDRAVCEACRVQVVSSPADAAKRKLMQGA